MGIWREEERRKKGKKGVSHFMAFKREGEEAEKQVNHEFSHWKIRLLFNSNLLFLSPLLPCSCRRERKSTSYSSSFHLPLNPL
jgi:hypothetical protein